MSAYSEQHNDLLPIDDDSEFLQHSTLLIDGHNGVYIPQRFAEQYRPFITKECLNDDINDDLDVLEEGPDGEWYDDAWQSVLDKVVIVLPDNKKYTLYQDDDLYAVPMSID